jgi:IclR family transcriptional regulator, acetate operon repressor
MEPATHMLTEDLGGVAAIPTVTTGTQAIDRAAQILCLLIEGDDAYSVSELVARTGLPKSTTSRLVRALERHGLAQRDATDGRMRPGPVLVRYAQRGGPQDLMTMAEPTLQRLSDATGETINLGVASEHGAEQIAQISSKFFLSTTNWVGVRVPFHASAIGKVLMAFGMAPVPSGRLRRLTENTITAPTLLRVELRRTRERSYAVSYEELELGLVTIAAPVHGADGEVVAAISISGPTIRMGKDRIPGLAALIRQEAAELSARIASKTSQEGAA